MNAKYRIAIIGAGQLGSRHLQGLVRLLEPCEIHVVDPSADALELSRQRVNDVRAVTAHSLHYHQNIEALPEILDHAIVATAADVRLAVMQKLLLGRVVRNLLLEKVLFQRLPDYKSASELIQHSGSRTWVNCTRRAFPIYDTLRSFFSKDPLQHIDVRGGNWGLGCNSIHFIDIIAYLSGGEPHSISTALLDQDLIESKRAGFKEFTGTLLGGCGNATFSITSQRDSQAPLLLTLRGGIRSCIVDESAGRAFMCDPLDGGWSMLEFKTPLLSELVTAVTQRILEQGNSELTPYAHSAAYHLSILEALGEHVALNLGDSYDQLPIT